MDDKSEDFEKDVEIFLDALKSVVSGKSDLVLIEKTFKHLDKFHDFSHFLADSDIREKDIEYAEMQNQELKKFILALEQKDYAFAESISFLSSSDV